MYTNTEEGFDKEEGIQCRFHILRGEIVFTERDYHKDIGL